MRAPVRSLVVAIAFVLWGGGARAFGTLGHRVASTVAEARLTPAARAKVRDLLEPGETLAQASLWADEQRRSLPGSAAWHYVNVPLAELHYDARFCPPSGCVVSKIQEVRSTLTSDASSRDDKQKALRLLVHLVEDLHQPLHVGDRSDRGGNDLQVQFFGRGTNLHRVWDQDLLERHGTDESAWVAELEQLAKTEPARGWSKGTVESWADESVVAARQAYRDPGSGAAFEPGATLDQAYFDAALPVVKRRLAQAAVRLASMLNEIFQTRQTH